MKWVSTISAIIRYSHIRGYTYLRKLLLAALCLQVASPVAAQSTPASATPPVTQQRAFTDIHRELARGQALLDNKDPRAEALLRNTAQQALDSLNTLVGYDILKPATTTATPSGVVVAATRQTAQAHYLWGVAADRASQRDIAITALARATRLAGEPANGTNLLARESLFVLSGILREGLPLVAADDVLDTISRTAHGSLWKPQRFRFELPIALEPPRPASSGEARSTPVAARDFLITSGRLFPPLDTSQARASSAAQPRTDNGILARIPPLYRAVTPEALPRVLKLDKMVIGYARETEGANRGLWRQVVRVYYPSTFLTRGERDDRPRAEALCAQFLKIHAMTRAGLGLSNPYAADGVTSVWLSEVSAWWPKDDEDPAVQTALGLVMPPLNVAQPGEDREVDSTPLSRPWYAAGQIDSAPGEIMFFKMTEAREESEWLREVIHEYGHIALPAIGGFKPPLEPYANGEVGEALGMIWTASLPLDLLQLGTTNAPNGVRSTPGTAGDTPDVLRADIEAYVARSTIPALRLWNAQGPNSPFSRDGTARGLEYLKGLAIYVDRVYGSALLGAACKPLVAISSSAPDSKSRLKALNTGSLLASLPVALREPFASGMKSLPIWLPGALASPSLKLSPTDLIARTPQRLHANERVTAWLFVPPTASALTVAWKNVRSSTAGALRVEGDWKTVPASRPAGTEGVLRLAVAARPGWQQFTFVPSQDITIQSAAFER